MSEKWTVWKSLSGLFEMLDDLPWLLIFPCFYIYKTTESQGRSDQKIQQAEKD